MGPEQATDGHGGHLEGNTRDDDIVAHLEEELVGLTRSGCDTRRPRVSDRPSTPCLVRSADQPRLTRFDPPPIRPTRSARVKPWRKWLGVAALGSWVYFAIDGLF